MRDYLSRFLDTIKFLTPDPWIIIPVEETDVAGIRIDGKLILMENKF